MEEIQIGEFIRSNLGSIGKVTKIEDGKFLYEEKELICFITNVVQHSFSLLDILKIGDFIHTDYGWGWYHHKVDENTIVIDDGDEFIDVKKDEIHRILTQEMLWDNSYELKE